MKRIALPCLAAGVFFSVLVHGAENPAPAAETAFLPEPAVVTVAGSETKPLVLKIAVNDIYCRKTSCSCISNIATRDYTVFLSDLKSNHKITLKFTYFMEVFDLEKALQTKKFDGVLCKPWTALRLADKVGAKYLRVADILDPNDKATMNGQFVVTANSPIRSLEDLQGKPIAVGQRDSYEKYQSPMRMLAAKNIQPQKALCFSSCGENLDALLSGKVDAAVISSYALTASCAMDFMKPGDVKTIAETEPMPLTSLILDMNKVSAVDAARLQAALVAESGGKAPKDLAGHGFVLPASWRPSPLAAEADTGIEQPATKHKQ
jgi:ABC-type phosphate/phosphonate transport system substrate-binding protein